MPRRAKNPDPSPRRLTYAGSGVDIDAGDAAVAKILSHMRRTRTPRVIENPGGFAGLFRLDFNERLFQKNYKDPVLVACTDGVGTKLKLAISTNRHTTIGQDLVAMSVNDLIVQGAEPLFFLDYIATHAVDPDHIASIVEGIAGACRLAGCALLGGETAEMPDMYAAGDYDLAGFAVGVVELKRAINPLRVEPGDVVLALESSGPHSNGYSLIRRIVEHAGLDLNAVYPELTRERATSRNGTPTSHAATLHDRTLADHLLEPTRIYADPIVRLLRAYRVKKVISGMAHITGGGLPGNLDRALNPSTDAVISRKSWTPHPVFGFLQRMGNVETDEMFRVFNMGLGYCLIVRPTFADAITHRLTKLGETVHRIGAIKKGTGRVVLK